MRDNFEYNHSHKRQVVWKHGPNWPFFALMLRTKLYQNPFFFTRHQNVNKPKSRAARTVYGLIFLPFYKTIAICQRNTNYHSIKHRTKSQTTQIISFSLIFTRSYLPVQNLGDRHPNTIELTSCLVHVLCDFKAT